MKDQAKGICSILFVGLKSKMYSLVKLDYKEIKRAKDVNRSAISNIKHEEYVNTLFSKKTKKLRLNIKRNQSKLHQIGTSDVNKVSLLCFDDNRYILNFRIESFAYSHKHKAM